MGIYIKMADPDISRRRKGDSFDAKQFGSRLRASRETGGFTQLEWATLIGRVPQAISNWESGRVLPGYGDLLKYHDRLGCDLHWLLSGTQFNPFEVVQATLRVMKEKPLQTTGD